MPNVGKSTLFNALTSTAHAETANYPFCTIEPNSGQVNVPDPRLGKISEIAKAARIVPTHLEFVDIAGLVKGASKGEGLGNKFLTHIREVDAIIHVLRCFGDENITHVGKTLDPVRGAEVVETELMLADLAGLERRTDLLVKKVKAGEKNSNEVLNLLERSLQTLCTGEPARKMALRDAEESRFRMLGLLTSKPVLYVCNVDENSAATGNELSEKVDVYAESQNANSLFISAQIEAEVSQLEEDFEKAEFLKTIGLNETGLVRLIRAGYELLNLITYFTAGPNEVRAWTDVSEYNFLRYINGDLS